MLNIKTLVFAGAFAASGLALASDNCGEVPAAPEIVDGATATMEELVANSESVKAFVAGADTYLDCREGFIKTDTFKAMTDQEKKAFIDANGALLDLRNAIGPSFNEQVGVYTKAHPDTE
jgi:hypothetical protein